MTVYHMHHIIPKHMGGTYDPKNLVKLTIDEHAQAHKQLYELYGKWEDNLAYLGLSGLLESGDIAQAAIKAGQRKGGHIVGSLPKDPVKQAKKIYDMWRLPGMREHLIEKRKEQSRNGKNPMQGKQQKKVCCLNCKSIISVNGLKAHYKKCYK